MRVLSFFLLILFLVSPSSSLVFFVLRRTGVGYVGHPLSLSFLFLSPLIRFYDACTADSMPTESVRTKNQMLIRLLKIPVIHEISFRSFDPFRFNFILSNFSRGIFYIYMADLLSYTFHPPRLRIIHLRSFEFYRFSLPPLFFAPR